MRFIGALKAPGDDHLYPYDIFSQQVRMDRPTFPCSMLHTAPQIPSPAATTAGEGLCEQVSRGTVRPVLLLAPIPCRAIRGHRGAGACSITWGANAPRSLNNS